MQFKGILLILGDSSGDKMKTRPTTIKKWNEYEFKLSIPTKIDKNNKIEIYFKYQDPNTKKYVQIKKSTGIDRYALPKVYLRQAKDLVEVLIGLINDGYNFVTKSFPDYQKLNSNSRIGECIGAWFKVRETDFEGKKISKAELDATKMVFNYYVDWLQKQNLLHEKPSMVTRTDIDMFMRTIEKQRKVKRKDGTSKISKTKLSPRTYNGYLYKLNFFFDWLIGERLLNYNPCKDAHVYNTRNIETRFKIFDDAELEKVKRLLQTDVKYHDLFIASNLLYTFRLRGVEQLRLRLGWFSFISGVLSIPAQTIDRNGELINSTKNGMAANFKLPDNLIDTLIKYIGDDGIGNKDWFLFGGHNKVGKKEMDKQFFTNKWNAFKRDYKLPDHLKFYALKHTSNFNSYAVLGADGLMQLNRHASPSQSYDYIKSKERLRTIEVDESQHF